MFSPGKNKEDENVSLQVKVRLNSFPIDGKVRAMSTIFIIFSFSYFGGLKNEGKNDESSCWQNYLFFCSSLTMWNIVLNQCSPLKNVKNNYPPSSQPRLSAWKYKAVISCLQSPPLKCWSILAYLQHVGQQKAGDTENPLRNLSIYGARYMLYKWNSFMLQRTLCVKFFTSKKI